MAEEKAAGVPTIEQVMDGTLHLIQELNGEMLGSAFSSSLMLTGDAEEYVKDEYAKLDEVLEENRKDGTAAGFFVPGNRGFFELFSRWIPLSCTLEAVSYTHLNRLGSSGKRKLDCGKPSAPGKRIRLVYENAGKGSYPTVNGRRNCGCGRLYPSSVCSLRTDFQKGVHKCCKLIMYRKNIRILRHLKISIWN